MPPRKRPKTTEPTEPTAKQQSKEDDIDWKNHPAKLFLKKCFVNGTISMNYQTKNGGPGPREVWDEHCKDNPLFTGMKYGTKFTNRLLGVRNDNEKKMNRKEDDQKAYDNYRANHPRPTHDHKGIPLWDGSPAQQLLKEMMARGEHVGKAPKELWEGEHKEVFQVYTLDVFRDHIYQEKRLWKMQNYLKKEAAKKREDATKNTTSKKKKKKRKKDDGNISSEDSTGDSD